MLKIYLLISALLFSNYCFSQSKTEEIYKSNTAAVVCNFNTNDVFKMNTIDATYNQLNGNANCNYFIKNDSSIFSSFEDYKILASQGVYQLNKDQKNHFNTVRLKARNNDTNCRDKKKQILNRNIINYFYDYSKYMAIF